MKRATAGRGGVRPTMARRAVGIMLATAIAVVGFGGIGLAQSGGNGNKSAKLLGPKDPASGTPVKVGFVYDGRTASLDSTYQFEASNAIVKYLNEYQGGLGGHPIELVSCEAGLNDTAKATDCANELIQKGVVLVVMDSTSAAVTVHRILAQNGIPVMISSIANRDLLSEPNSTFVLSDAFAAQHALPIAVAKQNKVKKVTAVVIDVPPATELYTGEIGVQAFKKAKIDLELVRIPAAQADMSPQMAQIAAGDPTEVHIVGGENFCVSALNGLKAAVFDGPISLLNICATEGTRQAVGAEYIKGASLASNTPFGDTKDPGYKKFQAIVDKYDADITPEEMDSALAGYLVWMGLREATDGLSGTVDTKTIPAAIKSMPNATLPIGGMTFRCNGKAQPTLPAMCTVGTLLTKLDINGEPVLPWKKAGNSSVPD